MVAIPLPPGKWQFFDINGDPLVDGTLETYAPGGLTPKDTFQNYQGTILNSNPITLDARGEAIIWGTGRYRTILKDALGNEIWDRETAGFIAADTGVTAALAYVLESPDGSALSPGQQGDLYVPFACTITAATALADQTGSVVVDIWKAPFGSYPPTISDKITASAPVTITTDDHSTDTTLTGWTLAVAAGDCLRFNINSCTTITRVNTTLTITK